MSLGHRERVIKALNHEEVDRVPFDLGGTGNSSVHVDKYQELKAYFGVEAEDTFLSFFLQSVFVHEPILQALDVDFRCVAPTGISDVDQYIPVGEDGLEDEWGIVRRKPPGCRYYDVVKFPLAGPIRISDIVNYPWPDPTSPNLTKGLRDQVLALRENTDCAIALRLPSPFVHTSQFLRGFEDWFADLVADPKLSAALFDAVVEYSCAQAKQILQAAGDLVDLVAFGDDLGFQNGPMVSPELYRSRIKPWHKKYFDTLKDNTDAFIHFHCCGSIYKLLDDLIDLGVDVINPVQVAATDMDSAKLVSEFGDRVSFWGGVDTQRVMPDGTPDEVKAEVRRRIADFAPGGGYVLGAVHNIQPEVPLENIIALYEAGNEFGRYPIGQGSSSDQ